MGNKIVSIRCRRHKKRFNVERDWLKTSEWLCPKCYGKLSPTERQHYAPRRGEQPEVRVAEIGKPTMYSEMAGEAKGVKNKKPCSFIDRLSKIKPVARYAPPRGERSKGTADLISNYIDRRSQMRQSSYMQEQKKVQAPFSSLPLQRAETKLSELMPRYKIQCFKCGEVVPCHGFWLEKTKVLCPSCASSMSGEEIESFNKLHSAPDLVKRNERYEIQKRNEELRDSKRDDILQGESDIVSFGGGCTERFLRRATEKELIEAVMKGKLSKVRCRIEMRRRECPEYFEACHGDQEKSFGMQ